MIGYVAVGMLGFFLGWVFMFILSCLHHAKYYDRMIEAEKELQLYEDICAINDDV